MQGIDKNEKTSNLIDTHTHITPNVDDGSSSIEMSLEMLRSEAAQGGARFFSHRTALPLKLKDPRMSMQR